MKPRAIPGRPLSKNDILGTMAVMTRKLGKDSKMQKADNVRIMHQNVLLIKEVNDLRHDLKMARADTHDLEVIMGFNSKNRPPDIVGGTNIHNSACKTTQHVFMCHPEVV